MRLQCGCCGEMFSADQHWNYDKGFGRCAICCDWILQRAKEQPANAARQVEADIIREAMRSQWPIISGEANQPA